MSSPSQASEGDKTEIQVIKFPTDQIDPSPFQARKRFDEDGIKEMGESILEHGIIQPLIVRVADPATGRLELVAGERRWRGAKSVGLTVVPVIVRELSATQAEEVMLIENLRREDLTESEEATSFDRMLKLTAEDGVTLLYTVETLARKLGENATYIIACLKLLLCPKELVEAVDDGTVKVSIAMLVGRIPDPKARAECAREVLMPPHQQVPLNYEQTKELIRSRFVVRLDKKDFALDDAMLVPMKKDDAGQRCMGGACTDCPFRSGNLEGVETQTATNAQGKKGGSSRGVDPNMCTLPKCHKTKMDAAWRLKKEEAQQNDQRVLDGEAAAEAFAGHNGDLAFDGDYVNPAEAVNLHFGSVYVSKSWKDALKDSGLKTVLARHPETRQIMQLYDRAEATEALRVLVEHEQAEAKQAEKARAKGDEELAKAAADKDAKAKEAEQAKVDKIAASEGVREVIDGITAKGVSLEFYDHLFQMALTHSGADGMYFLGHYLEIELKGRVNSGRDYEEEIIRIVRERADTPNAWMGWTTAALFARQVKWNGIGSDDLEVCLKLLGFKVPDIKRRAQTLYAVEKKGKGRKAAEAPAAKGSSTDPVGYSTDKEVELSAAADARAKEKDRPGWAIADKEGYLKALLEDAVPVTEPNENGVYVDVTEFVLVANKKTSISISLARSADGRWAYGYSNPGGGGKGPWQKELHASRSSIVYHAAHCLQSSLKSTVGERSKEEEKGRALLLPVIEFILDKTRRPISDYCCDKCGIEAYVAAGEGMKAAHTPKGDLICQDCGGAWPDFFTGWKAAGLDFTKNFEDRRAEGVARGKLVPVDCIGHMPKKGTPANKKWQAERVKLLRAAEKWKKECATKVQPKTSSEGKPTKK